MKKLLISLVLAIATNFAFACNITILPNQTHVCYGQTLTAEYPSYFTPVSFLWSTGETTSSISITASGSYSVSVTGYIGNSSNSITRYKCRYYSVSPNPVIVPLTALKLCKFETVELITNFPTYCGTTYEWFTGQGGYSTGPNFQYTFTAAGGPPRPDTLSVWCKVTANGCSVTTDPIMVRSYREGQLADWFHGNAGRFNLDLSGTIPAGKILNYPVTDLHKFMAIFTEVGNVANQVIAESSIGSIQIPLSGLEWGKQYDVEVFPVVNGITYCSGRISRIGIKPAPVGRLSLEEEVTLLDDGPKTFTFFSVTGQVLLNKKDAEKYDSEWLKEIVPQVVILQVIDSSGKNITRKITVAD